MDETKEDPYFQLKPEAPTPLNEICSCEGDVVLLLRGEYTLNPLSCAACNREVEPERIGFDQALAEKLAFWRRFHNCFHYLWLESGEFEDWAFDQLSDPESQVNIQGLETLESLANVNPAYYWWFQDIGKEGFSELTSCPKCGSELTRVTWASGCEPCRIFVANNG